MERRVLHSIDLHVIYVRLRKATDPIETHQFDLNFGSMTLLEAKHKGRLAVGIQKELERAYHTYFIDHGALKSDETNYAPSDDPSMDCRLQF